MAQVTAAPARLSQELIAHLQNPQLVLVTTIDADSGWPSNILITWVLALDGERLRLAADAGGRIITNVKGDEKVLLTIMTPGACHTIEGNGRVAADRLNGPKLQLGCVEVQVQAVRDVTFYGGRVTAAPRYEVTYDEGLKETLDRSVFDAMRQL